VSTVPEAVRAYRRDRPSPWIVRFAGLIDPAGWVLDVACGTGRHSRWLTERGHPITAIDRDAGALAESGAVDPILCDLEAGTEANDAWPLGDRRFAGVVVTNYLHRPLFPLLVDALAPGGVLLYETFAVGNERYGKPSNPAFLLRPGELLDACRSLAIVAFEDGLIAEPGPASIQRICAIRLRAAEDGACRHPL
jgi:SAM-dependent methyltransferase